MRYANTATRCLSTIGADGFVGPVNQVFISQSDMLENNAICKCFNSLPVVSNNIYISRIVGLL